MDVRLFKYTDILYGKRIYKHREEAVHAMKMYKTWVIWLTGF